MGFPEQVTTSLVVDSPTFDVGRDEGVAGPEGEDGIDGNLEPYHAGFVLASTLQVDVGAFTTMDFCDQYDNVLQADQPRADHVGETALICSGDLIGLWTVTASGPFTFEEVQPGWLATVVVALSANLSPALFVAQRVSLMDPVGTVTLIAALIPGNGTMMSPLLTEARDAVAGLDGDDPARLAVEALVEAMQTLLL